MANQTMLRICHLLNQCDGCENKQPNRQALKKEVLESLCAGCENIEQIKQLRPLIDSGRPDNLKRILEKGEDMTTREIIFLVNQGVSKNDIKNALGMNHVYFLEMMHDLGLVKRKKVSG